jgi:hypothetical protein
MITEYFTILAIGVVSGVFASAFVWGFGFAISALLHIVFKNNH